MDTSAQAYMHYLYITEDIIMQCESTNCIWDEMYKEIFLGDCAAKIFEETPGKVFDWLIKRDIPGLWNTC